ncbi:MAG TPA: glycosyltransferase [Vicinamibacterales bacterium]|nr:glycosyltransferase [Vicinamibacterales bacterium]
MIATTLRREEQPHAGRVNVLFLMIQVTGIGGSERLVLDLVRHLDRGRFAPSIGWLAGEEPHDEFRKLRVPLYHVPKRRRFDASAMARLRQIVGEQRIDVINAHHFMPFVYAAYAACTTRGVHLVYTEHSERDVLLVTGKWRALGRLLLPSCGVVGVSDPVSDSLRRHFHLDPGRVSTIENGVDLARFTEARPRRATIRRQLGIPADDVVFGQVANFKENKNHLFLLKAFHELARRRSDVRLLLIGRGFPEDLDDTEATITRFIREHDLGDRVHMLGYRSDVHELLAAMDAVCLVSDREGLPLSLVEAMASGIPVVGTRVEGILSVVEPHVNGLLVEPNDVDGLTRALASLVNDTALRCRLGAAASRQARERYALARCIDQTQQLFLSGLDRPAVRLGSHAAVG